MKLIGYVRAEAAQADVGGPVAQEKAIRAWSMANGHTVAAIHSDLTRPGEGPAVLPPGLSRALDALRPPPHATGLVVKNLDSLADSLPVQEAALAVAWKAGGTVFTVEDGQVRPEGSEDPLRRLVRQATRAAAAFERGHPRKRRKATLPAVVSDEVEEIAVRRIMDLRASGKPYRAIAVQLNAEGLEPGRATSWSATSVRSVFQHQSSIHY